MVSFFFIFEEKMVGSAATKKGRSANRKHTYFFFGLIALTLTSQINLFDKPISNFICVCWYFSIFNILLANSEDPDQR